jgi:hypothetical protein
MKTITILIFVLLFSFACSAQTTDSKTFSSELQLMKPTNSVGTKTDSLKFTSEPGVIKASYNENKQNQNTGSKSVGNEPKSVQGVVQEDKK